MRLLLVLVALACAPGGARAATLVVAETGGDYTRIQDALDVAVAGDVVQVRQKATPWFEKLVFRSSGDAVNGHVTLQAYPGEHPVLDGTGVAPPDPDADHMILIEDRSWVKVIGLEIRNHLGVNDGSGIRVVGGGSHIELRDNDIHDVRGADAMGITVYGTRATPISNLVIHGNTIRDCEPAHSEALALNGNVTDFAVTGNVVRDVNNIGIVFIGGETDIQPDPTKVARNGVCRGNTVIRARSIYGGGFAGGIYVDGGRDIVVENNVVTESDLGIEIGAENAGIVARNVTVRNNLLYRNEKAGLVFGGYAAGAGRVRDSVFTGNTCWQNDTIGLPFGELWIQYAEDNQVRSNIFVSSAANRLLGSDAGNVGNRLDYNLWLTGGPGAAELTWNGTTYTAFPAYQAGTGQDTASLFADPLLVAPAAGDFHLGPGSPAIDAGDPAFVPGGGEVDLDGAARVNGPRVDVGADESTACGNGVVEAPEGCDDANQTSGDGCDANCTPTGCGNGIVTSGEQCDDGNTATGDCCGAACQYETAGTPCDDGAACSIDDVCDGGGTCAGALEPAPVCRQAGRSGIAVLDGQPDTKDRVGWKWLKGEATSRAEWGDPVGGTTGYTLCVWGTAGGVPTPPLVARMPGGGTCAGKRCWKATGTKGFAYADKDATPDGAAKLVLRAGAEGRAAITLKLRGENIALPFALPYPQDPSVTVQLKSSDGRCWGSVFQAPATRNGTAKFKDKAP